MQTTKYTTVRQLGAMLKDEYNPNYCRTNANFTNGGADPVQLQPGTIFSGGTTPTVFDETPVTPLAATGICVSSVLVQPGATVPITYLSDGPGILNNNEIDLPVDPIKRATVEAAITALGFKLVSGLAV